MIINLFSIFDPSTITAKLAWIPCLIPIVIGFQSFKWTPKTKIITSLKSLTSYINKELGSLLSQTEKKLSSKVLISIFSSVMLVNLVALTPFTFTPTAHLTISFSMALIFWFSFILFGWRKNFFNIMSHLVPTGTPAQLINFIVLIETVRNLIRPITLSVRLSANIVAGHLLLSLLGTFTLIRIENSWRVPLVFCLTVLELGVSIIQAYVLITLISLYSTEVH